MDMHNCINWILTYIYKDISHLRKSLTVHKKPIVKRGDIILIQLLFDILECAIIAKNDITF